MDLAKNLAQWRDQSPEQWMAQANRILPPIVVAVLILLIAFKAADLTWRLLDSPADQDIVPPPAQVAASAAGPAETGYDVLTAWTPFGRPPDENSEAIVADLLLDAPDTTLNLTLHGAWQAQELPERGSVVVPEKGVAVISSGRGQQRVYWTGQNIEDVAAATLHSVFVDRVLLDRGGGRLETLRFPETDATPAQNSRLVARTPTMPTIQPDSLNAAAELADSVGQVAAVLGQHIQFAGQTENGRIIGFRVQPMGDGQVFSQLGLEPGDVLTEVNGLALANGLNIPQLMQALGESAQASVTVRRNGADQALILNIGDVQRLADSLQ
jgi:general secretion pathway protein C